MPRLEQLGVEPTVPFVSVTAAVVVLLPGVIVFLRHVVGVFVTYYARHKYYWYKLIWEVPYLLIKALFKASALYFPPVYIMIAFGFWCALVCAPFSSEYRGYLLEFVSFDFSDDEE